MLPVSVVMTCYSGDSLEALQEAVNSVIGQTVKFYEFVIVVDGPVDQDMRVYLHDIEKKHDRLTVKWLELNSGVAVARNAGMAFAGGEYIAIMDSDDVMLPERLECQYRAIIEKRVDAVWSWQDEFYDGTGEYAGRKTCPEWHDSIVRSLKWRNLLPDPATFVKKTCVIQSGGYSEDVTLGTDYIFFVRLLLGGCQFYCIQKPLIKVRVSQEQRRRRGGFARFREDIVVRKWMLSHGFISSLQFYSMVCVSFIFRMQPNFIRDVVYRRLLRGRPD